LLGSVYVEFAYNIIQSDLSFIYNFCIGGDGTRKYSRMAIPLDYSSSGTNGNCGDLIRTWRSVFHKGCFMLLSALGILRIPRRLNLSRGKRRVE